VTEGGLTETGAWHAQPYLKYAALRKVWQDEGLMALPEALPEIAGGGIICSGRTHRAFTAMPNPGLTRDRALVAISGATCGIPPSRMPVFWPMMATP
jgi:hypothetical protein